MPFRLGPTLGPPAGSDSVFSWRAFFAGFLAGGVAATATHFALVGVGNLLDVRLVPERGTDIPASAVLLVVFLITYAAVLRRARRFD